jgi:hypothetical protein
MQTSTNELGSRNQMVNWNGNWVRYRFFTKSVEDFRPIIFNPKFPWWCSGHRINGETFEASCIICYLPLNEDLKKYWDDAFDIESTYENDIQFTDRFPKPKWFAE